MGTCPVISYQPIGWRSRLLPDRYSNGLMTEPIQIVRMGQLRDPMHTVKCVMPRAR